MFYFDSTKGLYDLNKASIKLLYIITVTLFKNYKLNERIRTNGLD